MKLLSFEEIKKLESQLYMPTFARYPVTFVKGDGCRLWDNTGQEYIDFLSGIGVCNVGHCHPRLVKAVQKQVEELIHVSNLFYTLPQLELAQRLVQNSIEGKCFFVNSGAEANESALKLVRKYFWVKGEERRETITAYGSFHGRTFETMAATGQQKKKKSFEPLPPGFKHIPFNDIEALKKAITPQTAAVLLEPLQGEGGVYPADLGYLQEVRKVCDEEGIILILDEIQTGLGRTGKFLAYEHFGIKPDIVTLAKGLAGGLPIGVAIAKTHLADTFEPGDHGSTFGGNPLACAAAVATLNIIFDENLIDKSAKLGRYFINELQNIANRFDIIKEVRGLGLMVGVELEKELAKQLAQKFLKRRIVAGTAGEKVLRFLPPLVVEKEQIDQVLKNFVEILEVGLA